MECRDEHSARSKRFVTCSGQLQFASDLT
jgi:hypothetical protein